MYVVNTLVEYSCEKLQARLFSIFAPQEGFAQNGTKIIFPPIITKFLQNFGELYCSNKSGASLHFCQRGSHLCRLFTAQCTIIPYSASAFKMSSFSSNTRICFSRTTSCMLTESRTTQTVTSSAAPAHHSAVCSAHSRSLCVYSANYARCPCAQSAAAVGSPPIRTRSLGFCCGDAERGCVWITAQSVSSDDQSRCSCIEVRWRWECVRAPWRRERFVPLPPPAPDESCDS